MYQNSVQNKAMLLESGSCAGAENIDDRLRDFAVRLLNRTAEGRRSFLALAERELGDSKDEIKSIALDFIRDLCEAADKRKGERRGA